MNFTICDIMRERPCQDNYPLDRVRALWAGRESISHREVAALDIPVEDRIWALSRLLYRLSPQRHRRVKRLIGLDVAPLWSCPDIIWWYLTSGDAAVDAAAWNAAWAVDADAVARAAADAAAKATARAGADAAAWTVDAAARAAADAAAWNAARAAARAAAKAPARDAARARYLNWICRFGFEV